MSHVKNRMKNVWPRGFRGSDVASAVSFKLFLLLSSFVRLASSSLSLVFVSSYSCLLSDHANTKTIKETKSRDL